MQAGSSTNTCIVSISPSNSTYSSAGGTGLVAIAAQEGCTWSVTTSYFWNHIDSSLTNAGNGTGVYFVEANASSAPRSGAIRIDGQYFLVSQAGVPSTNNCLVSFSPSNSTYTAAGGTGVVAVAAQEGCTWNVSTTNAWLH